MIDDLIKLVMTQVGLSEGSARGGTGMVFALLEKFGDNGPIGKLFDLIPGAGDLAGEQRSAVEEGAGGLGGLVGGLLGGGAGDAMKALDAFKSLDLDLDQGKQIAGVVGGFVKDKGGADILQEALGDKADWLKALL